jgi:hypothetical protein
LVHLRAGQIIFVGSSCIAIFKIAFPVWFFKSDCDLARRVFFECCEDLVNKIIGDVWLTK